MTGFRRAIAIGLVSLLWLHIPNIIEAQEERPGLIPIGFGPETLMRQFQSSFETTYIDPDKYIVSPGDKFAILFTSNQITDIRCEINTGGNLFVKSVGLIELGHITLKQAIDRISDRVRIIYPKADFTIQLTGFRIVRVNVTGEVKNPGIYYAPAIWRTSEVIDMAGGLTENALVREIKLCGFGHEYTADLVRFNALGDPESNPLICNGSTIEVPHRRSASGHVSISGLVNRPGTFTYVNQDRLTDMIDYAGGLSGPLTDMEIIVSSSGGQEKLRFDGDSSAVLDWKPSMGDNIKLVWKEDRRNFGTVDIFGAVIRPGRFTILQDGFTLADLYRLSGGASAEGCPEMIQIFRRRPAGNASGDISRYASPEPDGGDNGDQMIGGPYQLSRVSLNPREVFSADELELIDGDSLYIPYATGMVLVSGAVASPGMVKFSEKKAITYYINKAGGYGFDADKARAVIINPYTGGRISADKANHLFDGEILFIPRKDSKARQ
jgi:protein involved in polysaccharide export with SLBB domain